MLGLVKIVDKGPVSAALMAVGLFVLGIALQVLAPRAAMLSLLVYLLSTAVVCFVVLRHGHKAAIQVLSIAFIALFVVSLLLLKSGLVLPTTAFVFWLSVSEEDKAKFPDGQLDSMAKQVGSTLPVAIGLSVMLVALCSVYIARWWQASIVNPGGFQKEFHGLRYGKYVALGGVLLIALALSAGGANGFALAVLAIMCFFIQGLAVVHALVKQRGMSQAWLVGVYFMLILPQTILLLGALGMSDNLFSLRKSVE